MRDARHLVGVGTRLTDGRCGYEVVDWHRRFGSPWFRLMNVEDQRDAWFPLEDLDELAFAKGESRERREML